MERRSQELQDNRHLPISQAGNRSSGTSETAVDVDDKDSRSVANNAEKYEAGDMVELNNEYKVMARRKGEPWNPWTGIWYYQKEMTLEKVKQFMRERWHPKYTLNYDHQLNFGVFRRTVTENNGNIVKGKWELIKELSWAIK